MRRLRSGVEAIVLLGILGCSSSPATKSDETTDILQARFPEAQAEIKASRAATTEAALNRDWQTLRSYHLEGPKFTKFGSEERRLGFEEMIADEIAMSSSMLDAIPDISADFRDQKIDVFGDTAVETAFFVVTGTLPDGVELELKLRITSVWVRAADGWKIAHEHNTLTPDIVEDRFPGDEAAIRAAMLELDDVVNRQDWDALRSSHLDGEKFSKLKRGQGRQDFEEMIAEEIANMSVMKDFKIDFRDLKIDVFGDVAVASSPALYTWTDQSGKAIERDMLATMVWVKTAEGWRIAHEHNSQAQGE